MIVLDENIPSDQSNLLRAAGFHCRRIGEDVAYFSAQDRDIIVTLHRLKRPTFFTRDADFFKRSLIHKNYALVWLDVKPVETAEFVRRFLTDVRFVKSRDRSEIVARVHHDGIDVLKRHAPMTKLTWMPRR